MNEEVLDGSSTIFIASYDMWPSKYDDKENVLLVRLNWNLFFSPYLIQRESKQKLKRYCLSKLYIQ